MRTPEFFWNCRNDCHMCGACSRGFSQSARGGRGGGVKKTVAPQPVWPSGEPRNNKKKRKKNRAESFGPSGAGC